ncbi:MAG: lysophospholipid acyltransferase family protein [Anaerovoracaceae bacterium]
MSAIRNISTGLRILNSVRALNFHSRIIAQARESGNVESEKTAIAAGTDEWAERVRGILDMHVNVTGSENIPEDDGMVIIANHQGYADIVALLIAFKGRQLGFVAKEELKKIPYIGKWIEIIRSVYIKRGDPREAVASIKSGAALVKQGFNLAIFPEGTRSRCAAPGKFKAGSFRLATMSKAKIVPVTIDGTYHIYEEKGSVVKGVNVSVTIHPAVNTSKLDRKELKGIESKVYDTVVSALPDSSSK